MELAYLLHMRPYRETSAMVDLLSQEHGPVRAIVKGLKRSSKASQHLRGTLQPFQPILCEWRGQGELKNLIKAEAHAGGRSFRNEALYSAIYVNELVTKLLRSVEDFAELFERYEEVLAALEHCQKSATEEKPRDGDETSAASGLCSLDLLGIELRKFEFYLIQALGYGLDFFNAAETNRPIDRSGFYRYAPEVGFSSVERSATRGRSIFSGREIVAIREGDWHYPMAAKQAKILTRVTISHLLGGIPLESRKLFAPS